MEDNREFAFLFYPGEYLRDTQCLSENAQVSYDRLMCEHIRNTSGEIYVPQLRIKFFTKKLTDEEREELMSVLKKVNDGFQIRWVAESISKRTGYVQSRRNNRMSKIKNNSNNISKTYDEHKVLVKEKEIVIEDSNSNSIKEKGGKKNKKQPNNKKPSTKKSSTDSGLNFYNLGTDKFMDVWNKLIQTKKWKVKMQLSLQMSLDKLQNYPSGFAISLIEEAIEKGWQGVVYDNVNEKLEKWKKENKFKDDKTNYDSDFRGNRISDN